MARLAETLLVVLARFTVGQMSSDFNAVVAVRECFGPRTTVAVLGEADSISGVANDRTAAPSGEWVGVGSGRPNVRQPYAAASGRIWHAAGHGRTQRPGHGMAPPVHISHRMRYCESWQHLMV